MQSKVSKHSTLQLAPTGIKKMWGWPQHANAPYCLKDVTNYSEFGGKIQVKLLWGFLIAHCFIVPHTLLARPDSFPLFFNVTKWQTVFPTGPQLLKNQTFSKLPWSRRKRFCGTMNTQVGWGDSAAEGWELALLPLRPAPGKGLCHLLSPAPREPPSAQCHTGGLSFHLEIQLSTKIANIPLAKDNPGKSSSITEKYFKKNGPKLYK